MCIIYIPIKNFHDNFIKLYKNVFKNQMYTFDWIYLSLTSILLNKFTFNNLKNYFIYTCILKKKKKYKKYIKYTIEFMLHVNETDIEYMYLMNKNDPYFPYITKKNPSYFSKEQFYDRLKNCDIIKKGKTLNEDAYLKYMYKNEKKRTFIIKEAKKRKKVKSKFLIKMKLFNCKIKKYANALLKV